MKPPVSVVVTCYNLEPFIEAAIASVHAQDYDGEIDLVVVDDCSTDLSLLLLRSIPEIRLVALPENGGVLVATIAGIEAARHDLIFFLDGDDRWEVGKLGACVPLFDAPNVTMITHDLVYVDEQDRVKPEPTRVTGRMTAIDPVHRGEAVRDAVLSIGDYVWLGSAYAIHRTRADFRGFATWARQLPDPRNTYQDWPLAYWAMTRPGATAGYHPGKWFRYRLHGSNHSGGASDLARLIRNFKRARNTTAAMVELATTYRVRPDFTRRLCQRVAFNDFVIALFEGRRRAALRLFPRAVPDLAARRILLKEMSRFGLVFFFGPEKATRLIHRYWGKLGSVRPS